MAYPAKVPVRFFKQGEYVEINGCLYVPARTCYPKERADRPYLYDCSECGGYMPKGWGFKPKYCMWCGARVEEGE